MPKLVTVVGATGLQGQAVIAALKDDPNYTLRGLTRNTAGKGANKLRSQGVEVVQAEADDVNSLKAAFASSSVVYAVTGIDELLALGDLEKAATYETRRGINIAQAVHETESVEHFIWSTLPPAKTISDGQFEPGNYVGKTRVDEYIRTQPDLMAKTTLLLIAQYAKNLMYAPLSVYQLPQAGSWAQFTTHPPETPIWWIGDVTKNLTFFIKPILDQADRTRGGAVFAHADVTTAEESLQLWAKVRGVKAVSIPVTPEIHHALWGGYSDVLGTMWRFWGVCKEKSWTYPGLKVLDRDDLGVPTKDFVSLEKSFESLKL
ncbi:hypothetical protein F5Y16DRAFT_214195 [Xylariaceae sp. FL0255]|nr:hypothetical protein F5Y16DRAFT_214195 [Xylariaceae sp. FL0255]